MWVSVKIENHDELFIFWRSLSTNLPWREEVVHDENNDPASSMTFCQNVDIPVPRRYLEGYGRLDRLIWVGCFGIVSSTLPNHSEWRAPTAGCQSIKMYRYGLGTISVWALLMPQSEIVYYGHFISLVPAWAPQTRTSAKNKKHSAARRIIQTERCNVCAVLGLDLIDYRYVGGFCPSRSRFTVDTLCTLSNARSEYKNKWKTIKIAGVERVPV